MLSIAAISAVVFRSCTISKLARQFQNANLPLQSLHRQARNGFLAILWFNRLKQRLRKLGSRMKCEATVPRSTADSARNRKSQFRYSYQQILRRSMYGVAIRRLPHGRTRFDLQDRGGYQRVFCTRPFSSNLQTVRRWTMILI